MGMERLRLDVILSAKEKLTGPLKRVMAGSSATSRSLKGLRDNLKQLENQQGLIDKFRNAHKASKALRAEIAAQKRKIREMAVEHAAAGNVTDAMARRMASAKGELAGLQARVSPLRQSIQTLTGRMEQAGLSTRGLRTQEATLRAEMERTTASIDKQKQRLQHLSAAQHNMQRLGVKGAAITAGGMGAMYASRHAAQAMAPMMGQGKSLEMEGVRINALGLGAEESGKAIDFAKGFKSYGTSQLDNMQLMRDAITVFNDRHHAEEALPFLAKMKFANEGAFGSEHGADNEKKFMDMMKVIEMRNGANNREDFERNGNLVQQVITATGGRVGAEDWLNLIKTGGVAAKGIGEKEFFYRLEPLVQEMGGHRVGTGMMSAYQNIYQGKTTKRSAMLLDNLGLIADRSKVKHDKVGQVAQLGVGALKGSDIFQRSQFEWLETVLIPALEKKGITSEKQILDAMGGIFSNRNAAGLFATMYQQRAMLNKSYKLNESADNVETLYGRVKPTAAGNELELLARRNDLYARMSTTLLPAYVKLLQVVTDATEGISRFAGEHPQLTKWVLYGVGALGLLTAGLAAVAIPIGLVMAKGALLRFVLARVGLSIGGIGTAVRAVGSAFTFGGQWLGAFAARMALYGPAVLRFGAVFLRLLGPIGLLMTAGTMLYSRWDDVVGGAKLLWADLSEAVSNGLQSVLGLTTRFYEAGANIVQGLVNGITGRLSAVRDTISTMADDSIGWFKDKLGIHSPSRVFMQLGGFVSEGAALGIEGGTGRAKAAALSLAAATMVPLPSLAAAPVPSMGGMGGAGAASGAGAPKIEINVYAQPGMDAAAIGRAVAAELEKRERDKGTRRRSSYTDME